MLQLLYETAATVNFRIMNPSLLFCADVMVFTFAVCYLQYTWFICLLYRVLHDMILFLLYFTFYMFVHVDCLVE